MDRRHQSARRRQILISAAVLFSVSASNSSLADVELNAEEMTIQGQSELPKVLYVVPWKRTETSKIEMPTTASMAANVLTPIDPALFQKQIRYHELLKKKFSTEYLIAEMSASRKQTQKQTNNQKLEAMPDDSNCQVQDELFKRECNTASPPAEAFRNIENE